MKPNRNQGTGSIPYGPKGKKPHGKLRGAQKPHKPHTHPPKANQRLDNPAAFTQPRTLRSVLGDANTAANLRYGGQERALGLQAQQVPVWYQQYQAQLKGIGQGVQQGYQQGAADVMARQQQTAASDTTARNSLGAQMQKDAASRGATVDPSLLANDVNAANVRNTNSSAFANLLGAQGQAQGAYFGGLQSAGSAAELGQKTRIGQEQQGVATDKGAYKSQYVSDAKDTERKYGLDLRHQAVEDAAFQVDTLTAQGKLRNDQRKIKQAAAKTKADAKAKRAARKAAGRGERNSVITSGALAGKTHGWVRRHPGQADKLVADYNKPAPKATGKDGLTPAQKRAAQEKTAKAQSRIETATQLYDTYRKTPGKRDGKPAMPRPQDSYAYLIGKGYSKVEVDLARDRLRNGGRLSARGMQVAKAHGIRVPKEWRPQAKPKTHFHGSHGG
jgi:hypothetical protein